MKNSILTFVAILLLAPQAFGQKVVHTERYAQDNQKLLSRADIGHRVVLMGDSITDFWPKRSPGIFVEHPNLVDRALKRCHVPVQMQVYPEGPHGFGFIIEDDVEDVLEAAYRADVFRDLECWLSQL